MHISVSLYARFQFDFDPRQRLTFLIMFLIKLLCLFVCVKADMSVHHVYVNRKTRSNSPPVESGFVYSQTNNEPASYTTYSSSDYDKDMKTSKLDNDFERLKSLSNYEMSKNIEKTNALFDSSMKMSNVDFGGDYHMDDEDVRTNARNLYDSWPYHYAPYEYMYDVHPESVKDKRYVQPSSDVKPVHEFVDEEMPNNMAGVQQTERYLRNVYTTPYTPIEHVHNGNAPYIPNNYYDRAKYNDDDTLTFKGLDFFNDSPELYHTNSHGIHPPIHDTYIYDNNKHLINKDIGKYVTEKAYDKKHEFDKHEKGNKDKQFHRGEYENGGKKHKEYKDFVDAFGNKFDSGNMNKDSKFKLENSAHKGEKKKGFHRVYHKNEYQEDNEFFDNNEKKASALENAGTSFNAGHTNGLIHSHGAASLGNEGIGFHNIGGVDKESFDNGHSGHDVVKGANRDLNAFVNLNKNVGINNYRDQIHQY